MGSTNIELEKDGVGEGGAVWGDSRVWSTFWRMEKVKCVRGLGLL